MTRRLRPRFVPSLAFPRLVPPLGIMMGIDKAERVHSYVQAQLPFVPFYGTDILAPVDSLPEAFDLKTPVLTARNPHIIIQPELYPPSASTYLEIEGSGSVSAHAGHALTKRSIKVQKNRSVYHPLGAEERRRPLRPKRCARTTPDPVQLAEPAKERTPVKTQKKRHCEKPRLPTTLSFLYSLAPKNIGPSRLTVSRLRTPRNPMLIISRYLLAIRVFSGKENYP